MGWSRFAVVAAVASALACGGGGGTSPGGGAIVTPDAGGGHVTPDAGTPPDAGTADAGTSDAGVPDGSVTWTPPPPIDFPTVKDWTFYGPQNGGPHDVYQVTADQGGNIWVAGGEDGLFLLRPGATTFERFTMDDGLRPYGYMPDGSDPVGPKYLKVIAVTGGPPGTVFVGYHGLPGCEDAWDNAPNPSSVAYIYKSGDADKVSLTPTGIHVVHYDIFSGPGLVTNEMAGREKLCTIYRLVYNPATNDLWFGGNHGFAWGDPNYAGNPKCNGAPSCSGVAEHSHPAYNGCSSDNGCGAWVWVTDEYRGIAVAPDGDVWVGGLDRTTKFHWGWATSKYPTSTPRNRFMAAAELTEWSTTDGSTCPDNVFPCFIQNRIDVWPDLVGEIPGGAPLPSQRKPMDAVHGIAALPDGSVYVGGYGLRHLDAFGKLIADEAARANSSSVGAVALDPSDGSVWVGNLYAGGLSRLQGSATAKYGFNLFGNLANMGIEDIQLDRSGAQRRVLVGFRANGTTAGFVAVYQGQ